MSPAASGMSSEAVSLQMALRRLWSDHVVWTRSYVVAAVAGTPDAEAAATRLLKNQEDIGNAVAFVYGETAGQALTDLLKQHIMIAVDLIEAAKSGNDAVFEENDRKWTENAEEIAALLSGANPDNWPKADVLDLLMQHLNLTKGEVVARLQSKWNDDVEAFDQIFTEILTVADVLGDGVIKQFPEKFGEHEAMSKPDESMGQTPTEGQTGVREADGDGGLYRWDDPNFDKSRDVMHTPGTSQYIGPSPPGKIAAGLATPVADEVVERHT
jgi:hypothetical protein